MKVKAELIDENIENEILLETKQLKVPLSLVSNDSSLSFLLRAIIRIYVF